MFVCRRIYCLKYKTAQGKKIHKKLASGQLLWNERTNERTSAVVVVVVKKIVQLRLAWHSIWQVAINLNTRVFVMAFFLIVYAAVGI